MERCSVVVIPALNPEEEFIGYVSDLAERGFSKIIVVDDGSDDRAKNVFRAVAEIPQVRVLTHAVNMGKGRALKDAFNYYCVKYSADFRGVITADSDGQHTVEDAVKLDRALRENDGALILGVRNFNDKSVPFKSRFGNKTTRVMMKLFVPSRKNAGGGGSFNRHTNRIKSRSE